MTGIWNSFTEQGYEFKHHCENNSSISSASNWIVLVGDSNTRMIFQEFISILCTIHVECQLHSAYIKSSTVKHKGDATSLTTPHTFKHGDVELFVYHPNNNNIIRLSFRMCTAGSLSDKRLHGQIKNLNRLFCPLADGRTCEMGVPVPIPKSLLAQQHPNYVFINDGIWGLPTALNATAVSKFFRSLRRLRQSSQLFWLSHYQLGLFYIILYYYYP
jgi:hypothetical protein